MTFVFTFFFMISWGRQHLEAMEKQVTNQKGARERRSRGLAGTATGKGNDSGLVPHGFGYVRFRSVLA
jgi:hypothetical protein